LKVRTFRFPIFLSDDLLVILLFCFVVVCVNWFVGGVDQLVESLVMTVFLMALFILMKRVRCQELVIDPLNDRICFKDIHLGRSAAKSFVMALSSIKLMVGRSDFRESAYYHGVGRSVRRQVWAIKIIDKRSNKVLAVIKPFDYKFLATQTLCELNRHLA